MADAFESILVAWLAFVFLPEKPTRSQGGTDGSNPLSSAGESVREAGFERPAQAPGDALWSEEEYIGVVGSTAVQRCRIG